MRGVLICFEGLDRSGKSTQVKLLNESLNQQKENSSTIIRFPDRTTLIGQQINAFLSGKQEISSEVMHLLFTANRWELKTKIIETLNQGINVIIDRYSYSGIAYSVARGLDYKWCSAPENGLPKPDVVFFLTVDNENTIMNRKDFGNEIFEKPEIQKKVKEVYQTKLIEKNWIEINSSMSIDSIHELILNKTNNLIASNRESCIDKLSFKY